LEPAETCEALSRVERTISCKPWTCARRLPSVSRLERGVTSMARSPSATAMETLAISFRYATMLLNVVARRADFVVAMDVNVLVEVARVADFLGEL